MTTAYNILYNGDLAFQKGLEERNATYRDDYQAVLSIEPFEFKEVLEDASKQKLTPFDVAESKAVKAIQRHSMKINSLERNRNIDDAYLLLGKSRYYSQRFVPAIEAFSYVIKNYPDADLTDEALVWKAKASIRLQDESQALLALRLLLKKPKVSDEVRERAHTVMAMAYFQMDSLSAVLKNLEAAVDLGKDADFKARNLMILGQLYRQEKDLKKSQDAFQRLRALSKVSEDYRIHAMIEQAKNAEKEPAVSRWIAQLQERIEDRENRPYLGALCYELAVLEGKRENRDAQIEYFLQSSSAEKASSTQKARALEALGNLYYEASDYTEAGAYYDKVLALFPNSEDRRFQILKKKRAKLETVINLQEILAENNRLLAILSMDEEAQKRYFLAQIDSLKKEEAAQKDALKFQESLKAYGQTETANVSLEGVEGNGGRWYFYNLQSLRTGVQEFQKRWGSRTLRDNWRWSKDLSFREGAEEEQDQGALTEQANVLPDRYQLSFYMRQLPSEDEQIDSIFNLRNNSYYELGLTYKEQFKDLVSAQEVFEKLLLCLPEKRLVLGAYHHLYKIHKEWADGKASVYENKILKEFPEAAIARRLGNKEGAVSIFSNGELNPEKRYEEIFSFYKTAVCEETLMEISEALRVFEGTPMVPKFRILEAYAIAKLRGQDAFVKALERLVLDHPNAEEAKKAKELIRKFK